jgi:hypothetical protein
MLEIMRHVIDKTLESSRVPFLIVDFEYMTKNIDGIDKLIITPDDIGLTFIDGRRHLEKHRALYEALINQGLSPAEYAKSFGYTRSGNPEEYEQEYRKAKYWLETGYPRVINGLIRLHVLGILEGKGDYEYDPENRVDQHFNVDLLDNFSSRNKYFEFIAMLVSAMYWSGTLASTYKEYSNANSVEAEMIFCDLDPESIAVIRQIFDKVVELDWKQPKPKLKAQPQELGISFRSCISRLLMLLGGYVHRKSTQKICVPDLIKAAFQTLHNSKLTRPQKCEDLASNILRDFVAMCFVLKGYRRNKRRYRLDLLSQRDRDIAFQQAETFMQIVEMVGLNGLNPRLTSCSATTNTSEGPVPAYYHRITVNSKDVQRLRYEMQGRVSQIISSI